MSFFKSKTPLEIAVEELEEAKRKKLEADTGVDYSKAISKYNQDRIVRLTKFIADEVEAQAAESNETALNEYLR